MMLGLLAYIRGFGFKDAGTGRFVTRAYAVDHPLTTYRVSYWRKP